jgi:hypothetical protein
MFEAKFYINPNRHFPNMPVFSFVNEKESLEFWMLGELVFCDKEYIINEVLPNLDKVINGDLEVYEFGYDATIIDFHNYRSLITYNYFENETEVPSQDLYNFMHNWGNFLNSI